MSYPPAPCAIITIDGEPWSLPTKALQAIINHAKAEEREACAQIAEEHEAADDGGECDAWDAGWRDAAREIAAAIRARGETT